MTRGRKRQFQAASTIQRWFRNIRPRTDVFSALPLMGRQRGGFSMTGTSRRRSTTSGRGITNEYDRRLIYKRRRMPYRRRKNWKKFCKRVYAASEKDLGSRTVVLNKTEPANYTFTGAGASLQGVFNCALYPSRSDGAKNTYLNDLNKIYINEAASTPALAVTGKCIFKSAVLDMTVCNTSTLGSTSGNASIPSLEVDVYEISAGRRFDKNTFTDGDLINIFNEGDTDTGVITAGNQSVALSSRGATPWDLPSALSEYKIKIWKKTKFFLGPGQTFTYQMRDPKRHVIDFQRVNSANANVNLPGITKWLLILFKATPCTIFTSESTPDNVRIHVGMTRKYLYKVMQQNEDRDALNL